MNLKPLLDRLKRTDAPTVEDCRRWVHWSVKLPSGAGMHAKVNDDEAFCVDGQWGYIADFDAGAEWTPLIDDVTLRALAALPGKVAEMAIERTDETIVKEHLDRPDPDSETDKAYDRAVTDVLNAVRQIDAKAIVEECLK